MLINLPTIKKKARELLLQSVDDDWPICELQPLIYIRSMNKANNVSLAVGVSERLHSILMRSKIETMLDLLELRASDLKSKCSMPSRCGLGITSIEDIIWSISNFHLHEKASQQIMSGMMPNKNVPLYTRSGMLAHDVGYHLEMV